MLDLFITRAIFYKNFKVLRLNFIEQTASEKRLFSVFLIFFFYLTNRSILIFHVSICKYFDYLHFLYQIFSIQ